MSTVAQETTFEMKPFDQLEYTRPDMEAIEKEFDQWLEKLESATSQDAAEEAIDNINSIRRKFDTMGTLVSIRNSVDTNDEFYEGEQDWFDNNSPTMSGLISKFYQLLLDSPYKNGLTEKYGQHVFNLAACTLRTFKPEIIEDLKKENSLGSQYQKLMASAKVMFEGEERTLSGLTPFELSPDRDMRRRASEAKYGWLAENQDKLEDIYDQLVKLRTGIAKKLGYNSFTELAYDRLNRTDYDAEQVKYYRGQILKHVVPVATKLYKRQQERLGLDSFKYYDEGLKFNSGNAEPKGSPEWIIDNGKQMYSELSAETKEFFDFMTGYNLLDLETKPGKAPGGYCTFLPEYRAPFIFSNFNGTSGDIDVLTHEAGHAFQIYQSRNFELPEYFWPTYEACEIHSMSMEFFAWPWMELFFKEDTGKYKFSHLAGTLLFLPYGAAVDEFQHEVYANPDMTPAERNAMWRKIEQKYLPLKDYDGMEYLEQGGYWQRQMHIYQGPFYYIDYTLAQVCALQFWSRSRDENDNAWSDYLTLCKAGGSKPFLSLVELAGLKSPFAAGSIEEVVAKAEAYLDQVDDTQF